MTTPGDPNSYLASLNLKQIVVPAELTRRAQPFAGASFSGNFNSLLDQAIKESLSASVGLSAGAIANIHGKISAHHNQHNLSKAGGYEKVSQVFSQVLAENNALRSQAFQLSAQND